MKWLPPLSSQGHLFQQHLLIFYCLYLCYKINSCFDKIYPASATDTLYTVYRHSVVLYFFLLIQEEVETLWGQLVVWSIFLSYTIFIFLNNSQVQGSNQYEVVNKPFLKGDGLIKVWLYTQKFFCTKVNPTQRIPSAKK